MERSTFDGFQKLIYRESGIVLTPQKLPLLSSRIQKRINALRLESEADYLRIVETDLSGSELIHLLDSISTNVTYFYREPSHFDEYRHMLSMWSKAGQTDFKIWCAAASSGEEPYTLTIEALEVLPRTSSFRLLGTDISTVVLKKAIAGIYPNTAVQKIPQELRRKYLEEIGDSEQHAWRVKREVAQNILFKRLNLVEQPYPLRGPFDIIFCRNVMIYFDNPTRQSIVTEFSRLLKPGGYLFLSHSENLLGVSHSLSKVSASVFQRGG